MKKTNKTLKNYSPLRYPGGKNRITPFVELLIEQTNIEKPIYIEPFAGGAGVALKLLVNNKVDEIVINDYDKAIYSMWRAILTETNRFIDLLKSTPVTVDEWKKQKMIYLNLNKKYSFELGFATFYLNRTNRSGILKAGPIGGYEQKGNYKIDVRFNKDDLEERIKIIASKKRKIHLYNSDIRHFFSSYFEKYEKRAFVYFDPPYYNKGKMLYKNFFNDGDHREIFNLINKIKSPWMLTYDNVEAIKKLYNTYEGYLFDLNYSVANSGRNSELLYLSNNLKLPCEKIKKEKINLNFRAINDFACNLKPPC